jgi:hypothetical protein
MRTTLDVSLSTPESIASSSDCWWPQTVGEFATSLFPASNDRYNLVSDKFEPRIAIRYLGGILELPTFWSQDPHDNQRTVARKLFFRLKQLIADQDVEYMLEPSESLGEIRADMQGVDIIATAFLDGVRNWQEQTKKQFLDTLMDDLRRVIEILLQ